MTWRVISMLLAFVFLFAPQLAARGEREAFFESTVIVETGDRALGAYALTLAYDPSDVEIESISGVGPFAANTFSNPSTYKSGSTKFLAFQSTSLREPAGSVQVANILWKRVGGRVGDSSVRLAEGVISDTSGMFVPSARAEVIIASMPIEEEMAGTENPSGGASDPPPGAAGNDPDAGRPAGNGAASADESPGDRAASNPNAFVGGWGCSRFF